MLCQCAYCLVLVHQRVKAADEEPELSHIRSETRRGNLFLSSSSVFIIHTHFCLFSASTEWDACCRHFSLFNLKFCSISS